MAASRLASKDVVFGLLAAHAFAQELKTLQSHGHAPQIAVLCTFQSNQAVNQVHLPHAQVE
jgi:hypothetical protein